MKPLAPPAGGGPDLDPGRGVLKPGLPLGLVCLHRGSRRPVSPRAAQPCAHAAETQASVQPHTRVRVPRSVHLQTHAHPSLPRPWAPTQSARRRCRVGGGARRLGIR